MSTAGRVPVEVDGHQLSLSNLDKVLWPATGFTKGAMIDYYARIAPVLVPHLAGRPLTLKRYPDGVEGPFFYEKRSPGHRPPWVRTVDVYSGRNGGDIPFTVVDGPATLVWLANIACIELHPSLSTGPDVARPTCVVFDLDPGPPADIVACCHIALALRDLFADLGLTAVVKTSGSKGLQVYVPLNTDVTYDATKTFALTVAQALERTLPDLVVSNMAKELRTAKVLVDWSQNDQHKTTVSVYSLRARERPTVSTPVEWDEVARVDRTGDGSHLVFEAGDVLARVAERGDLFAPLLELAQRLPG